MELHDTVACRRIIEAPSKRIQRNIEWLQACVTSNHLKLAVETDVEHSYEKTIVLSTHRAPHTKHPLKTTWRAGDIDKLGVFCNTTRTINCKGHAGIQIFESAINAYPHLWAKHDTGNKYRGKPVIVYKRRLFDADRLSAILLSIVEDETMIEPTFGSLET